MKNLIITITGIITLNLVSCCGCIIQPMPALRPMPDFSDDCHIPVDEPTKVFEHKGK